MHDCARAIQFLRSKAARWNIDPKRIAATGGSAGAGISLWLGFHDDLEFCRALPEKAGVAAIPCSCFWKDRHQGRELVRFTYCKKDETLEEGIRRLKNWLK